MITWTIGYDAYQRPRTIISPDFGTLTYDYDGLHRKVRVTYPDETFEHAEYRHLDVAAVRDREGRWTRYWHDAAGQLRLERDPAGRLTRYDWCGCGGLGAIVDGEGNRTEWEYDLQGKQTRKIYPDLTEIEYHYHEYTGRLDFIVDQLGRTRTYDYWLDGNVKKVSYGQPSGLPATPDVEFLYDDFFDRLTKMTDGIGETTYTYHPIDGQTLGAGQVHEIDGPFADDTITSTYDALGRVAKRQIDGTANEETYDHDPVGRLSQVINPLGTFDLKYEDPSNRLKELIYPNGQVTNFDYHNETDDFRLKEIENLDDAGVDPLSVFEYTYSPTGMIETWKQQAGTSSPNTWSFGYDRADQLRTAVLRDSSQAIVESFGYGYDNAGNRTHERNAQGSLGNSPGRGAVYNPNNQLTSRADDSAVRFAGEIDQGGIVWVDGEQATMGVDDSGTEPVQTFEHWLSLEPGTQEVEVEAVNEAGLSSTRTYEFTVSAQGAETLVYDLAGNLIERISGSNTTEYHWDGENQLVEIVYPNGSTTEFQYDGFGRRVRIHEKDDLGATVANRTFVWDGLTIAEERNGAGDTVTKRFHDFGVEILTGVDAGEYFYTKDHLGSIREVTDDDGVLQARYGYAPYGRETQTFGSFDSDFRFTGHFYHARSGLHLALYRAYDADLGRWLSRDPLSWAELLPEGPNAYGYVAGNPVNWVDDDGLARRRSPSGTPGGGRGRTPGASPTTPSLPPPGHPDRARTDPRASELGHCSRSVRKHFGPWNFNTTFPNSNRLAKRLGIPRGDLHKKKKEILKDKDPVDGRTWREICEEAGLGNNPDIGWDSQGNIAFRGRTGNRKILPTYTPIDTYNE